MKVEIRITVQQSSDFEAAFFGSGRRNYCAVLLGERTKDGKRPRLLLPGLLASQPNKTQLIDSIRKHLVRFGFAAKSIVVVESEK